MNSTDIYLQMYQARVQQLPRPARRLLALLLEHEGEELTRQDINKLLGGRGRRLTRYNIHMLKLLCEAGLVLPRRQRIEDKFPTLAGAPRDYRGNRITLMSMYYTYQIMPGVGDYLRRLRRPR